MTNRELIIHLIKEELRNKFFMHSLENLGLDCSSYSLQICHIILEKAGFKKISDELYEWYFELIIEALKQTTFLNLEEMLDKGTIIIYKTILKKKVVDNRKGNLSMPLP